VIYFKKGPRRGQGIVLDKPHGGVIGIVECAREDCGWRLVLTIDKVGYEPNGKDYNADKIASLLDDFLMKHRCGRPPPS